MGSESANKRLRVAEAIENSSASSLGEEGSEPETTAGLAIRLKRAAVRKQVRKSHFGSPMGSNNRRGSKGKSRGRGLRKEWTYQEEEALVEGVKRHGDGHWKSILEDPDLGPLLHLRSNVDLKDKARNLRNRNLL